MPGSGALAAAAGPKGKGSGGAMQIARCAANMAADGRRVVGGGRGTCYGTCETVRAPQGRNLTVLHAAAAAESRENLLRRMPWHLCIKINPAFRLISSSCARPYLGRLYILSEHIITLDGTFPAIQGWSHPYGWSRSSRYINEACQSQKHRHAPFAANFAAGPHGTPSPKSHLSKS